MREKMQWLDTTLPKSGRPGNRLFFGAVLAVIAVASGGCGDGSPPSQPAPRRLVQQPPQVDQTLAPAQTPPGAAAQPATGAPGMRGMAPGGRPGGMDLAGRNQPKPKIERDDDVSKWKTPDYFSAKKENDRRLLQAVQYIAENEKSVGNKTTASLLIKLLTAEEPKEEPKKDSAANRPRDRRGMGESGMGRPGMGESGRGESGRGMGGYGARSQVSRLDRQTIETIIMALAINGSKPAKKALRDVVLGALKTDDDSTATQGALAALAEDISPENETVLFRALTEPEKLRPEEKAASTRALHKAPGSMGMGRNYGASGKLSADALRQTALDIVEPAASEDLRMKLASHLLKPGMPSATINVLSGMLIKPHPNNVGPQLLLFQSSEPDLATKARIAGFFTEYSETALGHLLGVLKHTKHFNFGNQARETKPGSKQPRTGWGKQAAKTGWGNLPAGSKRSHGTGHEKGPGPMGERGMGMGGYANRPGKVLSTKQLMAADPEMPARIAQKLWSPKVARLIGDRLVQAPSLAEAGLVVPLARTMPVDDVRARLHRLMQTHWENGSRPFLSGVKISASGMGRGGMGREGMGMGMPGSGPGGQFDKPVCDPGFLVLVKMLPINPKKSSGRKTRGGRQNGGAEHGPGMGFRGTGGGPPIADWQKVHENLLYQFAAAFQAAARLNHDAQPVGALPVTLHTTKGIDTRFDLKWPESAPKQSGLALDPIEIHYVKISETADPEKVLKSYSRSLKTKHRMLQANRVALLSTMKEGSTPGNKLSVDVLITIQQPGIAAAPPADRKSKKSKRKTGEPLTVEILTIEIKDPSPPPPKTKAEKPKR